MSSLYNCDNSCNSFNIRNMLKKTSNSERHLTCDWQVTSAQAAQYLAFVLQKSPDQYVLGGIAENITEDRLGKNILNWDYGRGAMVVNNLQNRTINPGLENYFMSRNTNACISTRVEVEHKHVIICIYIPTRVE